MYRAPRSIFDLKPTAQRVLQYLITELQKTPNADAVYLAWVGAEEYFSENDIKSSRASFHRALSELIQKGLALRVFALNCIFSCHARGESKKPCSI